MLPERPPAERIQDILDHRLFNLGHIRMGYDVWEDYLQLCAEIDHLRAEIEGLKNGRDDGRVVIDPANVYVDVVAHMRRSFLASHLTSPEAVLAAVQGTSFEVYFSQAYPAQRARILAELFPVKKEN